MPLPRLKAMSPEHTDLCHRKGRHVHIVKMDADGNPEWDRTVRAGDPDRDDQRGRGRRIHPGDRYPALGARHTPRARSVLLPPVFRGDAGGIGFAAERLADFRLRSLRISDNSMFVAEKVHGRTPTP